jgi:hypothetical protein
MWYRKMFSKLLKPKSMKTAVCFYSIVIQLLKHENRRYFVENTLFYNCHYSIFSQNGDWPKQSHWMLFLYIFFFFTFSSKIESLLVDDLSSALVGRQDSGRHDRRGPAGNRKQLDGGHFDFDFSKSFLFSFHCYCINRQLHSSCQLI